MATPNALTYNGFVTQLGILAVLQTQTVGGVVQGVDSYFTSLIPQALNYAELRIQRDIDLLPSRTYNTYTLTAGTQTITMGVADFVTVLNLTTQANGLTLPLFPSTQEYIQNVYSSSASAGPPAVFAPIGGDQSTVGNTSNILLVGPQADQNYTVTVYGTVRMPSLASYATSGPASTSTTFISAWLPDLLLQAAMIYVTEFQRNFAAAGTSNDPQMPGSYEAAYQGLLKGALLEEVRKKFWSTGWSSESTSPAATPGR